MIFTAILSNKSHPEYGQATIPFPIPSSEYDHTIELLEAMGLGDALAQDCRVDEVSSGYPILNRLAVQSVNVDELDYLAKRLESFCAGEKHQFQAMACKLGLADVKDLINLTFCCQQATVITNFSDLEKVGRDHRMNLNGGTMPPGEYDHLDGTAIAIDLINSRTGVITPYGVVYSNDMKLEPLYDGRHFPPYLYEPSQMVIEIHSGQDGSPAGYLYLPAPDRQITRTLQRAGTGEEGFRMTVTMDDLPPQVSAAVSPDRDSCDDLNRLCRAVEPLSTAERKKLDAVVLMTQPTCAGEILQGYLKRRNMSSEHAVERKTGLALILSSGRRTHQLEFPASERELDAARQILGVEELTDNLIDSILNGCSCCHDLPLEDVTIKEFNTLAHYVQQMSDHEQEVFRAALEAEEPVSFADAVGIAERLDEYERGRSTIYEAPPAPAEETAEKFEMGGMSL